MLLLIFAAGESYGTVTCASDVQGVGIPIAAGVGEVSGGASVAGVGAPIAAGVGTVSCTATCSGVGAAITGGAGAAAGTATVAGVGGPVGAPSHRLNRGDDLTRTGVSLSRTDLLAA